MPTTAQRPLFETMEERILHSADLAPLVGTPDGAVQLLLHTPASEPAAQRSEIAFVDATLPDAGTLLADLQAQRAGGRAIEIVVIDAGVDGLALISDTLAGRRDIGAVHVLTHGGDGLLQLGGARLDAQTLLQRAGEIAAWADALNADADLLLYGCEVAQTAVGEQFVSSLAALTGADVAASADLTGAAAAGGDWALEFAVGRIDATSAIGLTAQQAWAGTLAVMFTSESSGDTNSSTTNYSFSHNVNSGSDRLLLVQLVTGAGVPATAVDFDGLALTFLSGQDAPGGQLRTEIWYRVAPPVTSGTVNVTLASPATLAVGATSYSGVNQSLPFGTVVKGSGTDGLPSVVVASGLGQMVVDLVGAKRVGSSDYTIGAGQTQSFMRTQGTGPTDLFALSSREAGAASVTMDHSFISGNPNWASIAVEINQVGTVAQITAAQDTYINSASTSNFGPSSDLVLNAQGGGLGNGRVLLQFDLSSIPAGATITSASLQLQATANNNTAANVDVYRLTQAWVEGSGGIDAANWIERLPGTAWSAAGGVYDSTAVATLSAPSGTGVHNWDLTTLAQAWFDASIVNTGVMLASPDSGNATFTYGSSESATPPRLIVTYTLSNVAPTITSNGGGPTAAIVVQENTSAVTTVSATDPEAAPLSYSIVGGADAARFAIDASSGVLRFVLPPNYEAPVDAGANNIYEVTVQASDGSLTDTQAITVSVGNATEAIRQIGEQLVNTATADTQITDLQARGSPNAVAVSAAGDQVVVWSSLNQDGSGWGVYGQRLDKNGAAIGGEFRINQVTAGNQYWATVAMAADGRFVASWTSEGQDGTTQSIYARQYNADGSAAGNEFRVNATSTGIQRNGSVAMDANGNFIVVWHGDGVGEGLPDFDSIYARRFNAAGIAIDAADFRVNDETTRHQWEPVVSMNASGAFAVTWDNNGGVQMRRFGSDGVALGGTTNVDNGASAGNGSIALADDGSLVVVWRETVVDVGIYMRRYDSAGVALGSASIVNTYLIGSQTHPSIAMDAGGNFIVAWEGPGFGDTGGGVAGQKFNAAGSAVGGEFQINQTTAGTQSRVSLAMLDLDNFTAVWSGQGPGDTSGVFARQYGTLSFAPVITSHGGAATVALGLPEGGTAVTTVTATDADGPALTFTLLGADAARFTIGAATGVLTFAIAPDFESPADAGADNVYDVVVQVSDGTSFVSQSFAITIGNVNDVAPVAAPASANGNEDTLLPITLSATDADSPVASFTLSSLPTNGVLYRDAARTLVAAAGTPYAASGDTLVLYFDPAANWSGSTAFNFLASDGAGLNSAVVAATLTVAAVNDPPLLSSAALALSEGQTVTLANGNFVISDPDSGAFTFTVSAVSGGYFQLSSLVGTPITTFTSAELGAGLVQFVDDGDEVAPGFSVKVNDGALDSGVIAAVISYTPVNDPPVLSSAALALSEGQTVTLANGNFVISDPDSGAFTFTVSAVSGGYFQLSSLVGTPITTFTSADLGAGLVQFVDDGDEVAPSFSVKVNDGALDSSVIAAAISYTPVNDPPLLIQPLADQGATQDVSFGFTVPVGTFSDVDIGDTLTYSAKLVSGAALPTWLVFDVATRSFSGTPANGDVGAIDVRVTATDLSGATASDDFVLTVINANDAPLLQLPITDRTISEDSAFVFTLPAKTFIDADAGDSLSYGATLASGAALPAWLSFDAATQTFSGTPANADVGSIVVRVAATDLSGAQAVGDFMLTVLNVNDAPRLAAPVADQSATQDVGFSFTLPPATFTDVDAGDTLSYGATLSSGAPLPSWLRFDAATRSFSGSPGNADVGLLSLRVTATDQAGASAAMNFDLRVIDVNDAPIQARAIGDRWATPDMSFQFSLQAGTFVDPDVGATLTYAAALTSGAPLPAWLSFDAATQTFRGVPTDAHLGHIDLRIMVTDDAGVSTYGDFRLNVGWPQDPPVIELAAAPLPAQALPEAVATTPVPDDVPPEPAVAISDPAARPVSMGSGDSSLAPVLETDVNFGDKRAGSEVQSVATGAPSRADAVLAPAVAITFDGIGLSPMSQLTAGDDLMRRFEEMRRQIETMGEEHRSAMASSIALTSGLSIGYIVWLVRGGVLLTSMLSALPAWQMIDPLPVLAAAGAGAGIAGGDGDDDEAERLFADQAGGRASVAASTQNQAAIDSALRAADAEETRA